MLHTLAMSSMLQQLSVSVNVTVVSLLFSAYFAENNDSNLRKTCNNEVKALTFEPKCTLLWEVTLSIYGNVRSGLA